MVYSQWYDNDYNLVRDRLRQESRKTREESIDAIGPIPTLALLVAEIVMDWLDPKYNENGFSSAGVMLGAVPRYTAMMRGLGADLANRQRATFPDFTAGAEPCFRYIVPRMTMDLGMDFSLTNAPSERASGEDHMLMMPYTAMFKYTLTPIVGATRTVAWFRSTHQAPEIAICRSALKACLYLEARERRERGA